MSKMKHSKKGTTVRDGGMSSSHLGTLHQRLRHALDLGFRYSNDAQVKWQSNDVEIQKLVVRSISAFLDCVSTETLRRPIVKDSVADMVTALGGILQYKNEAALGMTSVVALKLVNTLPRTVLQPHVFYLVHPLASLLSFHQLQVAVSCATALKLIISNLSVKKEKEVWGVLKEADAVAQIVSNLRKFSDGMKSTECFLEMASLLSEILQHWPSSRYPVWTDVKMMEILGLLCANPDISVKVAILQLYYALALCGYGAQQLLHNGDNLAKITVNCMGNSQTHSVRILAFKLAQRLMVNERGFSEVMRQACEPMIKCIVIALSDWSLPSEKVSDDHLSLLVEACRLALVTRWPGEHHAYLWKFRVDKVLLSLIIKNSNNLPTQQLSLEELVTVAREGLNADFIVLRPYVWEILGWLAAHCGADFNPNEHGNEIYFNVLVTTACLAFVDSIGRKHQLSLADCCDTSRSKSASKATLMMIYSPSKYLAYRARSVLSEILKVHSEEHLKYLLDTINFTSSRDNSRVQDMSQITLNMMGLTCYSALPQYSQHLMECRGISTLLAFLHWWLNNRVHIERMGLACHLHTTAKERTCCVTGIEDWGGTESPLLLALWSLSELFNHCDSEGIQVDVFSGKTTYNKEQFIKDLQDICIDTCSSGLRCYNSFFLSFLGFYGFPSKLGRRIQIALSEKENADLKLVHRDGEPLGVHSVILLVWCPSLLPPQGHFQEGASDCSSARQVTGERIKLQKEITLSAKVDYQALVKLLDFIYSGYLQVEEDLVRKLKIFSRVCNLQPLSQLLSRKRPKWGAPFPNFDLSPALGPCGHVFSDCILEAKSTGKTDSACSWCSLLAPHLHVHRIVLWSSCEYLRALFQSGMQESRSQTLKVPVSWEALSKLVVWFYSGNLPKPVSGCLWDNMDLDKKLCELQPYMELCWLAEFWFLDLIQEECFHVITRCLDSKWELSIKIIQIAANFSLWKLAEIAANYMAPFYPDLRKSGALDSLDEELVDMVRTASVQLAQKVHLN